MSGPSAPQSFKAFLSHRYKAPTVNLHFSTLFSRVAEVQFDVDVGSFVTNVTRLERLIRDSDGFIGIYPLDGPADASPSVETLLHESRYFRLELDLAIRSRKPAIVFYDRRFRNVLPFPAGIRSVAFDPLEIAGSGGFPSDARFERAFEEFSEMVFRRKAYDDLMQGVSDVPAAVAVILPSGPAKSGGYPSRCTELVHERLRAHGYLDVQPIPYPPRLDYATLCFLNRVDWAVAELGQAPIADVVAYLHGSFIPTMRLARILRGASGARLPIEEALYASTDVGYEKDVIRWRDANTLGRDLDARLASLATPTKRISTSREADEYFSSASLRKEAIFLSYSGSDHDVATELSAALKRRFQLVFDYRDGESIQPGAAWIEEIFRRLSASAVGIPLLSEDYLGSDNCLHEAREMTARRDSRELLLIPVKLNSGELELPAYLRDTQYLRAWEYERPDAIVDVVVRRLSDHSS